MFNKLTMKEKLQKCHCCTFKDFLPTVMLCERFVVVVVVVVVVITLQPIHFRLVEKIPSSLSCSSIDHEQTYRIRSDLTG